jgi:hypothetical protein
MRRYNTRTKRTGSTGSPPSCPHHWMINSDNVGTCKLCGLVRDFRLLQEQDVNRRKGLTRLLEKGK